MLSIGLLSKLSGVKVSTLRYYEQIGLIEPPHRSQGNQRRFEPSTLDRVKFIRSSRRLGLPTHSIRSLIELAKTPLMPCDEAHQIAVRHLAEVQKRIEQLERLQSELIRISAVCDTGTVGKCKVFEALSNWENQQPDKNG